MNTKTEELTALSAGAQMFANRLRKNLKHLGRWARREGVQCYRLYDADLPDYAVAVDVYEQWVHLQEYAPPKQIDAAKAEQRWQAVLATVPMVLEIPAERLFCKVRQRQKGTAQYEKQAASGQFYEVREGKAVFWVNFTDYLDTGLFLDHRLTRALVGQLAHGKHVLNLFAYTASASVHAALGGALSTTSVDMSRTYLDWARRNLTRNGFGERNHRLIQADCMAWLTTPLAEPVEARSTPLAEPVKARSTPLAEPVEARSTPLAEPVEARSTPLAEPVEARYGLIFLDPPTFSNSKRMREVMDIQRDHVKLIRAAVARLEPDGILLFSNNARHFQLDQAALSDLHCEDLSAATLPEDFKRNPRIHCCWKITRRLA